MRLLGIDYGEKRIGLAVSDPLGIIAQGLKFISAEDFFQKKGIEEFKELIEEFKISKIVMGFPLKMDGSIGKKGNEVQSFVERLKKHISLPFVMWDERLTTVTAENILINANLSRRRRKKVVDKMSAAIILQGYLDQQKQ
ncbi:Holliday junction resolvase RuvX [bacterium]|nr:Holliday junction resolvase RuvX [bacterium]